MDDDEFDHKSVQHLNTFRSKSKCIVCNKDLQDNLNENQIPLCQDDINILQHSCLFINLETIETIFLHQNELDYMNRNQDRLDSTFSTAELHFIEPEGYEFLLQESEDFRNTLRKEDVH